MDLNLTFHELAQASASRRSSIAAEIVRETGGLFERTERGSAAAGRLPEFTHVRSGIEFVFVPAGDSIFGFSNANEHAALGICDPLPFRPEKMRPARKRKVKSFLMTKTPMLAKVCRDVVPEHASAIREKDTFPAFVSREVALLTAERLDCHLPVELEWEHACRGGTETLFPWGDELPQTKSLWGWLNTNLSDPAKSRHNNFGLYGLFTGEWCDDAYRDSHKPSAKAMPNAWVIKGGGSYFWPWQHHEWMWCMPAMRAPSTGIPDNVCGFRLIFRL